MKYNILLILLQIILKTIPFVYNLSTHILQNSLFVRYSTQKSLISP